jgi:hypothetical protein
LKIECHGQVGVYDSPRPGGVVVGVIGDQIIAEVLSGNGDAFMSLTVEEDDEFSHTVACGRSGEPEVLYTMLNTGYGTKHWLLPGFLQGMPA